MEVDKRLIRGEEARLQVFVLMSFFLLKSFEVSPHIRGKLLCGAGVVKNNNTAKCKITPSAPTTIESRVFSGIDKGTKSNLLFDEINGASLNYLGVYSEVIW